jgi:hypothetical protein
MTRIRLRNVYFVDPGVRDVDGTHLPAWMSAEDGHFLEWDPSCNAIFYNKGVQGPRGEMIPRPFPPGRGQQFVSDSRSKGMEMMPEWLFPKYTGGGKWSLVPEDQLIPAPPVIPASAAEVFTPGRTVVPVENVPIPAPSGPAKWNTKPGVPIADPVNDPALIGLDEETRHAKRLAADAMVKAEQDRAAAKAAKKES